MPTENSQELQDAVDTLSALVEERSAILELLEGAFPEEMERLGALQREIPNAQDELKVAARAAGSGEHDVLGHHIKVSSRKKVSVDTVLLLEEARQRDEIDTLVDAGFLTYAVNAKQLGRLDGVQKAIYKPFIKEGEGTSAVTLPSSLKG